MFSLLFFLFLIRVMKGKSINLFSFPQNIVWNTLAAILSSHHFPSHSLSTADYPLQTSEAANFNADGSKKGIARFFSNEAT